MAVTETIPIIIILILVGALVGLQADLAPAFAEAVREVGADLSISHAVARHGGEALIARQCYERNPLKFYNPATGRTALACLTESGKFGIVILDEQGREITAFLKNKCRRWSQVIRYLRNAGYEIVH